MAMQLLSAAAESADNGGAQAEFAPAAFRELCSGSVDTEGESDVLRLQQRLVEIGYLAGEPDGCFGAQTETAVRVFQELNGLGVTGVADVATQIKLYFSDAFAPAPTPRINGDSGDAIRVAQEKLAQWGFLSGRVDGVFGDATEDAVKAYKTYVHEHEPPEANLPAEEMVGDDAPLPTATALAATPVPAMMLSAPAAAEPAAAEEIPTAEPAPVPTSAFVPSGEIDAEMFADLLADKFVVYRENVQNGSSGSEVMRLQKRLCHLGYLYIGLSGADGVFGDLTEGALRYFQLRNGLNATGVADAETQKILYSADAQTSNQRVFPYKLIVDISDQRVYAHSWNGERYDEIVRTMICSTGKDETPTPTGAWASDGRVGDWYYFEEFDCWAQYAFRILGGYMFHSVTFPEKDAPEPYSGAVANLGRQASHGCVRLTVEDAKWIYENCPSGITVVIQE